MNRPWRMALLSLGGLSLLAGLDAALLLLGLPAPVHGAGLSDGHGMLLVLGFLGTLIALERGHALRAPWGYLAPGLLGAGALLSIGPMAVSGRLLILTGLLLLCGVYAALWRRALEPTVLVQLVGAVLAGCAVLLWLRVEVSDLVPLLAGFLVLTIAAERAELARLAMPADAGGTLLALSGAVALAGLGTALWPAAASHVFGVTLLALVVWLLRHDVARHLARRGQGLPRYSAWALLAGYAWLVVAAATWAVGGRPTSVAPYDTVIHATFLGFAMSMVMAHAPVILPATLGVRLPYRPVLWVPLVVLHAGLIARVAGNATGQELLWRTGSVVTVLAVALFAVTAAGVALHARRSAPASVPRTPLISEARQ